jgi:hypothetical protein
VAVSIGNHPRILSVQKKPTTPGVTHAFRRSATPQPFDATLKDLVQAHPVDWVALLGGPVAGPIEVLTPDLSTVSAFADIVLRVPGGVLHLDFQSGPDPDVSSRMLLYNVLAYRHFEEPVLTVLVLLRPKADRSDLTGTLRYELWPGRGGLEFRFQVVRLWEVPVETLLAGGLGVAPLALLGKFPEGVAPEEGLPSVIEFLRECSPCENLPRLN